MLISMLEGLNDSESLVSVSSNLLVINSDWSDDSFSVNNEKSSQGCSVKTIILIFNENTIIFSDFFGNVRNQGDVNRSESSILFFGFSPSKMGEMWIDRNGQNLSIVFCNNYANYF